jgi:hypothetical protein
MPVINSKEISIDTIAYAVTITVIPATIIIVSDRFMYLPIEMYPPADMISEMSKNIKLTH